MEIQPGRFVTKGGQYAEILSQKTMRNGTVKYWHGRVLLSFTDRHGMQNAWNEDGSDMGGNPDLLLVAPAVIDASDILQ